MRDMPPIANLPKTSGDTAEERFWWESGEIAQGLYQSYASDADALRKLRELSVTLSESEFSEQDQRNIEALRVGQMVLRFILRLYGDTERKNSNTMEVRHPVRVVQIANQLFARLPEQWRGLREAATSPLETTELQMFLDTRKHSLRVLLTGLLHDVVEDFFDGDMARAEPELRTLLVRALAHFPGAADVDVEEILAAVRLTTKPASRYSDSSDKKRQDLEAGSPQYLVEYEAYLSRIEDAVQKNESGAALAMVIKLSDVLHNAATEKISELSVRTKKRGKAELVGRYVLSNFPHLRWIAARSPELTSLFERIRENNPFLWAEIEKLPEPPDDWVRESVDDVVSA